MRYLQIGIGGVFVALSIWLCHACASYPVPLTNQLPMGVAAVLFAAAGVVVLLDPSDFTAGPGDR